MFTWIRELSQIFYDNKLRKLRMEEEFTERKNLCQSCEILKMELERANIEKRLLLDKVLNPNNQFESKVHPPMTTIPQTKHIPWSIKRQTLEAEDRQKAAAIRSSAQPDTDIKDLEKELDVVQQERENHGS